MDVSEGCSNRWSESTGRLKPIDSAYLDDNDPDFVDPDEEEGGYDPDSYDFQDRWERRARKAEKMGKRVCWRCDSMFKPEGDEDMCPKCQETERQRMMNKKKPGAGAGGGKSGLTKKDRDYLDRLKNYHDDFGDRVNGIEARVSESRDFDEELLKPCPKCGGEAQFETVDDFPWVGGQIECADCGHHVYEILSGPDETRSRDEMMDILIDMWNNGEDADDDVNDYTMNESDSEGAVEIVWSVDYPKFGIESGDTETIFVDYDAVLKNDYDIESNRLKEEVCNKIAKVYPGLEFEPSDFDILNEREFWGEMASNTTYPYDESRIKMHH